ncbi:MAG: hypothetical protein GXO21_06995 [Aquificae bacterium]|nr:hypothetical protein [Aquificota bacterium]
MKKVFFFTFFLLFAFSILSCGDKPPDEEIIKYIEKRYSKIGKIENFKRLNGYTTEDGYYIVEYQFDLVLDIDKLRNIKKLNNPLKTLPYTTLLLLVSIQCPEILEGEDRCTLQEKAKFIKVENGWIPVE